MAAVQVETRKTVKRPHDFTFPPKYIHSSPTAVSIEEVIINAPNPRSLPNFGFPFYATIPIARNPSPRPTELPEIMTPLTPLDPTIPAPKGPTLLTIPLEIRLQIYNYVLLSHPIHHAHLSPNINEEKKEEFHTSMFKPNGLSFPTTSKRQLLTTTSSPPSENSTMFSIRHTRPCQIQGNIPAGLLASCKQVYAETHRLPFETSNFAFVNWFWSGVCAARQFSRALRSWQSSSLRYVSVEVLGRDLWVGGMARLGGGIEGGATSTGGFGGKEGKGLDEWRELCGLWDGVWGLRLGIKGSVVLDARKVADVDVQELDGEAGKWSSSSNRDSASALERENHQGKGILNVQMEWVIDGLLRMKSLRWIELEIEDEDVDRAVKLEFCAELESLLSELRNRDDGWTDHVKIVFVERIKEEEGKEKCYVGEPGDEDVWAARS